MTTFSIKKSLQLMFFLKKCAYAGSLFKILNILEFNDKVALGICFLISRILHKTLCFSTKHYLLNLALIVPDVQINFL